MDSGLLTQALIIVSLANIAVIGVALAGFVWLRREVRRPRDEAGSPSSGSTVVRSTPDASPSGTTSPSSAEAPALAPSAGADPLELDGGGSSSPNEDGRTPQLDPGPEAPGQHWREMLAVEDARTARTGRLATVISIEVVGIDRLSDRLGQDVAMRTTETVGAAISGSTRGMDRLVRLDGSFRILMPETDEAAAHVVAERLRAACDQWLEASGLAMRLAIGYASPPSGAALGEADRTAVELMHADRRGAG